jgi:AraC-like DNA-binding protein
MMQSSVPERAIEAYEALTGLTVCLHDDIGSLLGVLKSSRKYHLGPYCRAIKSGPFLHKCVEWEVVQVRRELNSMYHRGGRIQKCHAGLIEWVVPLMIEGKLMAILYAGQRRSSEYKVDAVQSRSSVETPKAPFLEERMGEHYLEALIQLGERLKDWLLKEGHIQHGGPNRFNQIQTFIEQNHTQPVKIGELAAILHVSSSRATHIVKEETGQSFSELLTKARLQTSKYLLLHSDEGLIQIAMMSGFHDSSLFHRTFRKATGLTPGKFRKARDNS